jgi:glutamyl-tRNA reductase
MPTIEADYLVIGAGAMGMAFADTIVTETNASLVIVDRYHHARLDLLGHLRPTTPADPVAREKLVQPIRSRLEATNAKLQML